MKIAIYGYGNLGRGVEAAASQNKDITLTGVFTRRAPESIASVSGVPVYAAENVRDHRADIDVLIICCGSATDLPQLTPALAAQFNVVDSFDTHARIPAHHAAVDAAAKGSGHIALIAAGWDPGLFFISRLYAAAVLPEGKDYTFWGKGVSQGHSEAIRHIPGVLDARSYTIPLQDAMDRVRAGEMPELKPGEKHRRACYVAVEEEADRGAIAAAIQAMPNYFAGYDTSVAFVSPEELRKEHGRLPHGGSVIRTGITGAGHSQRIEFALELASNPEFTASVLVAGARAIHRMAARGVRGCVTMFDIPPADLISLSGEELRATLL